MSSTKQLTLDAVRNYYGKVLKGSQDLQTSACCTAERLPADLAAVEALLADEVKDRFYGLRLAAAAGDRRRDRARSGLRLGA